MAILRRNLVFERSIFRFHVSLIPGVPNAHVLSCHFRARATSQGWGAWGWLNPQQPQRRVYCTTEMIHTSHIHKEAFFFMVFLGRYKTHAVILRYWGFFGLEENGGIELCINDKFVCLIANSETISRLVLAENMQLKESILVFLKHFFCVCVCVTLCRFLQEATVLSMFTSCSHLHLLAVHRAKHILFTSSISCSNFCSSQPLHNFWNSQVSCRTNTPCARRRVAIHVGVPQVMNWLPLKVVRNGHLSHLMIWWLWGFRRSDWILVTTLDLDVFFFWGGVGGLCNTNIAIHEIDIWLFEATRISWGGIEFWISLRKYQSVNSLDMLNILQFLISFVTFRILF